jgi:hypothetical protein
MNYPGGIPQLPANRRLRDTRNNDVRTAAEWFIHLSPKYGRDGSVEEVHRRIQNGTLEFVTD